MAKSSDKIDNLLIGLLDLSSCIRTWIYTNTWCFSIVSYNCKMCWVNTHLIYITFIGCSWKKVKIQFDWMLVRFIAPPRKIHQNTLPKFDINTGFLRCYCIFILIVWHPVQVLATQKSLTAIRILFDHKFQRKTINARDFFLIFVSVVKKYHKPNVKVNKQNELKINVKTQTAYVCLFILREK